MKQKQKISKSPAKLEQILTQLDNKTKKPVEGDVKAIVDLNNKMKKIKEQKNKPSSGSEDSSDSQKPSVNKHEIEKKINKMVLKIPKTTKSPTDKLSNSSGGRKEG